jgi:hypothetical protein
MKTRPASAAAMIFDMDVSPLICAAGMRARRSEAPA